MFLEELLLVSESEDGSLSVLQIRSGKRDNLRIIFHITPLKRML